MSQHQNIDPLEIEDLPSDPREMALRLLGMTRSEMREIDSKVVSGHNSVGGTRADYNKIAKEVLTQIAPNGSQPVNPQPQPPPQFVPSPIPQPAPVQQPIQHELPIQAIVNPGIDENRDQLEFDFYKKLKPEDIEYQLRVINSKLDNIETILKDFINKKNKKKFLINADTTQ